MIAPPSPDDPGTVEQAFEDAWATGTPPRIDDFLAALPSGDPCRRALLEYLVAADQEHRWKRAGPRLHRSSGGAADATLRGHIERPPRLEEYAARFPELDAPDAPLAADLIADEFRLRAAYDDPPPRPEEYAVRFPGRDLDLPARPVAGRADDIPGYELLYQIGGGGFAVVYLARPASQDRLVALKLLTNGLGRVERERFRTEAAVIRRLKHPNIVELVDVGEHQGRQYLALEYVAGGSLADRPPGPMSPRTAAELVAALAGAVDYAHSQGVVHRDLKPGNVLLSVVSSRCAVQKTSPPPTTGNCRGPTTDNGLLTTDNRSSPTSASPSCSTPAAA